MKKRIHNMKWQLPVYFLIVSAGTLALAVIGSIFLSSDSGWVNPAVWTEFFVALLLVGPTVGYFIARRFQSKLDMLHLGMKQVSKGNLSERLPTGGRDEFEAIYQDFNLMADSLQSRLKLLQQLGEAEIKENLKSNQDAVMEERKRLARDLHDTVSQQLFAVHMSASSLPKLLEVNPDGAKMVVDQLVAMSHHAQRQMRSLIAQLRPLELEDQTLEEALGKWFPDYCTQNGLQGKLEINLPGELPEAIEHQLFLIIQEGMANVVKHAKARNVSLTLYDTEHLYRLGIQDDGVGFVPDAQKRCSYGLSTMKERAERLGGDADIRSKPGTGTTVQVTIPKFDSIGGETEK